MAEERPPDTDEPGKTAHELEHERRNELQARALREAIARLRRLRGDEPPRREGDES